MKKTILTLAAVLMCAVSMNAQGHFRTFLDITVGTGTDHSGPITRFDNYELKDFRPALTIGLNVTEGYQILPMLYAGIGVGGYAILNDWVEDHGYEYGYNEGWHESDFHGFYCPVYADVRWTLPLNNNRVTPFVDLKVGYQMSVSYNNGDYWTYWDDDRSIRYRYKNGLYFVPSVGIRFGRPCGFNLGFGYNPGLHSEIYSISKYDPNQEPRLLSKKSYGTFMLTLGADF